jgi:hypothetical protein
MGWTTWLGFQVGKNSPFATTSRLAVELASLKFNIIYYLYTFYDITMSQRNSRSHGNCILALYIHANHGGNGATRNIQNIWFLFKIGMWVISLTRIFRETISRQCRKTLLVCLSTRSSFLCTAWVKSTVRLLNRGHWAARKECVMEYCVLRLKKVLINSEMTKCN